MDSEVMAGQVTAGEVTAGQVTAWEVAAGEVTARTDSDIESTARREPPEVLQIDCATCPMRAVSCDDCVVSVLLGPAEFDHDSAAALVVLADRGLIPPLQDPRRHAG
ncbi:MAG: hypothetical protein V9E98_08950 [Candidatus Nanopelagicales bacterium]